MLPCFVSVRSGDLQAIQGHSDEQNVWDWALVIEVTVEPVELLDIFFHVAVEISQIDLDECRDDVGNRIARDFEDHLLQLCVCAIEFRGLIVPAGILEFL